MTKGWTRIGPTAGIAAWAAAALPLAVRALAERGEARRSGGTWAVGLDLLPNDPAGRVGGVDFPWADVGLVAEPLHRAQVSAVYPGYPQPSPEESASAYAFRLNRDAAHLDGLLPVGVERLRMVKEPHAWILGVSLNVSDASPLVVWEGSHEVLRAALLAALAPHPPEVWGDVDLTEAYAAARRRVFETCPRVEVPVKPGQATLLHRLTLHGVAAWAEGATAPPEGRIIAYFRPQLSSIREWLTRD